MLKYFIKRIFVAIPVFLIIVTAVFFMVRFVPGGPFDRERPVSAETLQALNAYYGLDSPLYVQYFDFLKNLACGQLGPSYKYSGWTVNEILAQKAIVSLELGAVALVLALIIGLSFGLVSAGLSRKRLGGVFSFISLTGICLPAFVLGPVLILIFSLKLKWFNSMGWGDFPSDIFLPAFTLSLFYASWIARLSRNSAIDEKSKGYVRTALAKGASYRRIYMVHILRNAIQPVISYIAPAAAGLLTGSFVVETIFQIPGLGRFFISSALDNDYTMIMGCVIVYSGFIILLNLFADLLLAIVNPRIAKEFRK